MMEGPMDAGRRVAVTRFICVAVTRAASQSNRVFRNTSHVYVRFNTISRSRLRHHEYTERSGQ